MKKTIKLLCTWAASLLLAGCSSEADMSKLMDWQSNPDAVHFTASVNNATTRTNPAATDDAQTKFNENDQVTVSNNGNQADYAYNGKSWVPAITDKYLLWDRSNLTFNCWYPASDKNTATVGYLTEDQSSAELMAKSDYMNAETKLQTADEALKFGLVRKTARIILKISGFTNQFESTATIKHVRIVSKASTAEGEKNTIDITPLTSGEGGVGSTYTALVAPGEVVAKLYFTDDISTEKPLTMTTNVTEAGSSYIYNLTVSKDKIKVTGITAGSWTASGTTTGDLTPIPYVTFTADEEQTFIMSAKNSYKIPGLEYSVNNGTWKKVVTGEAVTFGGSKGTLSLRGKNNLEGTSKQYSAYSQISFGKTDVNVACTGDIRTLLDYTNYENVATESARFSQLFENCTQLTSAPDLPAKTLADGCYSYMFSGCSKLETGPKELPAITLANDCYSHMFSGCSKLETGPKELPATTLAESCYMGMFRDCTNLKNVPDELPAKTMFRKCYLNMFTGCSSLEGGPKLPATTLAESCYKNMFEDCKKLKTAPELNAISLKESCYFSMFWGCASLTAAPDLPATELAEYCYNGMFYGCENLSSVKMLAPSDQIKSDWFTSWLNKAGISATTRKLIVQDEAAYNALVNAGRLPDKWKTGTGGATVENYTPKP